MADYGPTEYAEETAQDLSDPHVILNCISECDAQILKLRKERESYIQKYQERMMGFEQHWHSVMNKPEDSMVDPGVPRPASW